MRFEQLYHDTNDSKLSVEEAANILGVSARTFRRYRDRFEEEGPMGLLDRRLSQMSNRTAPVDEAIAVVEAYKRYHADWSVRHYWSWYRRKGGKRSYNWVLKTLQLYGAVTPAPSRGKHRRRRDPCPKPGMMLFQDGSPHEWVPGKRWDLIVTMDDATNENYSMFLCEEEGTASSFLGIRETIEAKGLFCSLYTDRGSHYWHTPEAGGKVDKTNPTQFGVAMQRLGIMMIPSYCPQGRGRMERVFGTHQGRLPQELALAGITDMEAANDYIRTTYLPNHNEEFGRQAREEGSDFMPWTSLEPIDDILCERHERKVGNDNCVKFEGLALQIPADRYRNHYVKAKVVVRRHMDRSLSILYGPRLLARYKPDGSEDRWRTEPETKNKDAA